MTPPGAIYLHVPFCARRCSYCDFAVTVEREPPVAAWAGAIRRELELRAAAHDWALPLDPETVYLGGGTPSLLGTGGMAALREELEGLIRWDGRLREWTAEANPESFDGELARAWRAAGVTRISLGAQTFHEPALRWMGRLHGADGPARAMDAARAAGFGSVSVDLIFALPERLGRSWEADLERAVALEPEHVSLYGLTAESATPLGRWVASGSERLPDEERYAAEYLRAHERLSAEGFRHYEVSNFALPGHESAHNLAYWDGSAYLGLGPSAHSYLPPERSWNLRDWGAYRMAVESGRQPIEGRERLAGVVGGGDGDGGEAALETLWLGLRTRAGVALERLGERQLELARGWLGTGFADGGAWGAGVLRLTAEGWLMLDRLAVELDGAAECGLDRAGAVAGETGPAAPGLTLLPPKGQIPVQWKA